MLSRDRNSGLSGGGGTPGHVRTQEARIWDHRDMGTQRPLCPKQRWLLPPASPSLIKHGALQLCPHPSWQRSHLPPPFPTTAFPRQAHDDNTSARTQHGATPCVCPSRPHCAPSAFSSLPRLTAQWRRAHAQCAQVTAGNLPVPNMAAPTTSALPLAGAPRACAAPRAPWRRCGRCGGSAAPRG